MQNFFFILYLFLTPSNGLIIHHKFSLGSIRGRTMLSRNYKTFYAFLGIPYAEAPVGDLRFQDPVPLTRPWDETFDATQEAEPCIQGGAGGLDPKGVEDCLYLNIFTPKLPNDTSSKLPVWFFLYPGRHIFGDAHSSLYGPHYIMDHPVIFVTAAYRLGPFGFLSTEDDVIPGNFGLKDQAAVLLWIKNYIVEFGGDPNRVTLSGESSSSQDVVLHMMSPLSKSMEGFLTRYQNIYWRPLMTKNEKDLFHRSISQSGHCLNYRAVLTPGLARLQAWRFAEILGCKNWMIKTSEDLVECMRTIPAEYITGAMWFLMHDFILPHTYFGIVLEKADSEGAFLTNHPVFEIEKPINKSWLLGVNTEEGQQKALGIYAFPSNDKKLRDLVLDHFQKNERTLIPNLFGFDYAENSDEVLSLVRKRYYRDKPLNESFYGFSKAFGLSSIQTGMFEIALKFKGVRYFYHYDYLNTPAYEKMYIARFKFISRYKLGVIHGEELRSLIFQAVIFPPTMKGTDRLVSEKVVEFWTNFVIYGNPNGENEQVWKPITTNSLEYLYINITCEMRSQPFWDDYKFFKDLGMPQLMTPERATRAGFLKH